MDIGANVGKVFLKIINTAKNFSIHEAHLYEPNPENFAQLKEITLEKIQNLHFYNIGISDKKSESNFMKNGDMTKVINTEQSTGIAPDDMFNAVCVTGDEQIKYVCEEHINLLKIDVEGEEMSVLHSFNKAFANRNVDIIYIEVGFNKNGKQQTYFAKIDEYMQEFGYRVLGIYEQKEEWMSGSPVLRRANVAYMSDKYATQHPLNLMKELYELKNEINKLRNNQQVI